MSKYDVLWRKVAGCGEDECRLSFAEIADICGFPIDHAFLTYKKELPPLGWRVEKISQKEQ